MTNVRYHMRRHEDRYLIENLGDSAAKQWIGQLADDEVDGSLMNSVTLLHMAQQAYTAKQNEALQQGDVLCDDNAQGRALFVYSFIQFCVVLVESQRKYLLKESIHE